MEGELVVNGVRIGDTFKAGKNLKAVVVDFHEIVSLTKLKVVGHRCIAKGLGTMATNEFEVPFTTVIRNRI